MSKISDAIAPALATLNDLKINPADSTAIMNFLQRKPHDEINDAVAAFFAIVQHEPSFRPLVKGWLQSQWGGSLINGYALPLGLLRAVSQGSKIETIEEELGRFVADRSGITFSFVALSGFTVEEPIKIDDRLLLLPANEGNCPKRFRENRFPLAPTATAVLRITHDRQQILYERHEDVPEKAKKPKDIGQDIDMVISVAVVLTARSVDSLGLWQDFDGPAQLIQRGRGYSFHSSFNDGELAIASVNAPAIKEDDFVAFCGRWREIAVDQRKTLRIAINRLGQGFKRFNLVDRALDFGIALEILLLHNVSSNTELSFRFSVHGANFLGGIKDARLQNQKILKDMYNCRSKAAHEGHLKNEGEAKAVLDKAGPLAAEIAKRLVWRGSFPEWNSEYVIGADEAALSEEAK